MGGIHALFIKLRRLHCSINYLHTGYALECQVRFLLEKRTELYEWYYSGVSQRKNVPGAKKPAGLLALPEDGPADA